MEVYRMDKVYIIFWTQSGNTGASYGAGNR